MDAKPSLPRELRESLQSARADADRLVLWNLWELQQWVEATRSRGLAFLALDADVQRRFDRLPAKTLAATEEKTQDVAPTLQQVRGTAG